jgi:hypothetical protein
MADYWCANCGERSSMMGHWRGGVTSGGFTCKPKDETMTEISEAATAKARELCQFDHADQNRVARFIQQVSDAAKEYDGLTGLAPFILPEPVDPALDALIEDLRGCVADPERFAADMLRNLAKRGLKIVEATDANS